MLSKGTNICGYTIQFQLEEDYYCEYYQVKDKKGTPYTLKLIDIDLVPSSQLLKNGMLKEMVIVEGIHHPNIIKFYDQGIFKKDYKQYGYIVTESFHGFPLSEFIKEKFSFSDREICLIAQKTLNVLVYLQIQGIIHNNLNSKKILLPIGRNKCEQLKLIDFGYARVDIDPKDSSSLIGRDNFLLLAPEQLSGCGCMQSDIYSVGLIMYELLYRKLPWDIECDDFSSPETVLELFMDRTAPISFPERNGSKLDERIQRVIQIALRNDAECRYETAIDMSSDLDNILNNKVQDFFDDNPFSNAFEEKERECRKEGMQSANHHGNGFADVAGLEDVKEMLQRSIIRILKDRNRAKRYKISIPNGILLYGPPGCGKSFIAEKFAEEAGYHYMYFKSSDLSSIFLHGTQGNIGKLFEEAREKAPTIICFDEFDAMVPSRDNLYAQYQAGEVNEFLSQLNNCGKDNIFVIASSNKPELIDSAILRRGRIDKMFYIPPPDLDTRKRLFEIYLKDRPCSHDINCENLAMRTEYYVASDIAFLVNEAAICASEANAVITQSLLEDIIAANKPSLSKAILDQYENMKKNFEGNSSSHTSIGFHIDNDVYKTSHRLLR